LIFFDKVPERLLFPFWLADVFQVLVPNVFRVLVPDVFSDACKSSKIFESKFITHD